MIVINLFDCYGSSATISIRWAEQVQENVHKFIEPDFRETKNLESFGPKELSNK